MTGDGWFSAIQILTAVFASLLPAVLQIVVTSEAHGTWQSNEAVRLEGVYGWEIPKATSGPNVTPLQSSSALHKRRPCFSSVFWTYFLSSSLHAQFTAVYPILRLCCRKTCRDRRKDWRINYLLLYHWLSVSRPWSESLLGFIVDRTLFCVRYELGLKKSYIERTTDGSIPMYEIKASYVSGIKQGPLK